MVIPAGRPRFEVADVVRAHGDAYRRAHRPSAAQEAVLTHIAECRTAALGGHLEQCDGCGHQRLSYNSCRDRHCPKCQNTARAAWLTARLERLLPVPYFHVVFTIPDALNPLGLRNKKVLYDILFAAASQTLRTIAGDERHLGAQIGFTAVLHTWGQNLLFHPHLHCVVTGGGLSLDGTRWVAGRERYLVPVQVLAKLFRGKFLAALERAYRDGTLALAGSTAALADPVAWRRFRDRLYHKRWIVYAKPPFGGPEHVFRYLGRYTHRIAISNHRIVDIAGGRVTFSWKDYADGGKTKRMTLDAVEFLRRFLLHVLPHGFVRIRHYGLCASRNVNGKLETARHLLADDTDASPPPPAALAPAPMAPSTPASMTPPALPALSASTSPAPAPWWERFREQTGIDVMACPRCSQGRMVRQQSLAPVEATALAAHLATLRRDTS